MNKKLILILIFFTIFLDMFNLGLIYPIFSSLIFEGTNQLIPLNASGFYKNVIFGVLISAFPLGQFFGAPIIGHLSDRHGRRKVLIITLIGTVVTLSLCYIGVIYSSLLILLLSRLIGGAMAGNMTLAYAALADFSLKEEKVRNFALIPLAAGLGFAIGPYLAGILANPNTSQWSGPALPFLVAVGFSLVNLMLVVWKFPETLSVGKEDKKKVNLSSMTALLSVARDVSIRPYLMILFFMISSNFLFVQFVGPFAMEKFHIDVTGVGYLYANVGIAVAIGHLFLTRKLANYLSSEKALIWSLSSLGALLIILPFSSNLVILHIVTFFVMLACAVAYTNSMTLVSNQAPQERQGEIMGVAVSIQSCSEFLPAMILGLIAGFSQSIPIFVAASFAFMSYLILYPLSRKVLKIDS